MENYDSSLGSLLIWKSSQNFGKWKENSRGNKENWRKANNQRRSGGLGIQLGAENFDTTEESQKNMSFTIFS